MAHIPSFVRSHTCVIPHATSIYPNFVWFRIYRSRIFNASSSTQKSRPTGTIHYNISSYNTLEHRPFRTSVVAVTGFLCGRYLLAFAVALRCGRYECARYGRCSVVDCAISSNEPRQPVNSTNEIRRKFSFVSSVSFNFSLHFDSQKKSAQKYHFHCSVLGRRRRNSCVLQRTRLS